MAVVYRALDTLLNRFVSIKVLHAQFSTDEEFVRRFRREAQAAASLSHPNVVNIYDVGMEGDEYYIVMEFVDGLTLKEVIQDRAPLPVQEAIDICKQICSALGHAHENNIVHRDIKPHNILIGKDGRVKVTDFGIARAITSNTITQDGSVLGSVHYFSPEQARGGITDVKSDIYSLGVVLYEMLTGELPFSGETPISVALKHLQDHFVEPRQINPSLPQSVENIILKSLAKDPGVRYQSAREMARDLEKALLYPNVPKFTPPLFDEQSTIQMPAVGLRSAKPATAGSTQPPAEPVQSAEGNKPAAVEEEAGGKKKKNFWRPVIWLFAIFLLLGVGAVTAYTLVTNYMGEKDVTMPDVVGKTYDVAVKELLNAGLDINNINKEEEYSDKEPAGTVIRQDQYGGKTIKANREVTLTVSRGQEKMEMPVVTELSRDKALEKLKQEGVSAENVSFEEREDANAAAGTVLSQNPASGVTIDKVTRIVLTVAKAIEKASVPQLSGLTVQDATARLTGAGFKVGEVISQYSDKVPSGKVIGTSPSYTPGTELNKGETISLVVSQGTKEEPKKKTYDVQVPVGEGEKKRVKIVKNDAQSNAVVVDETIEATKTYHVEVIVKPGEIASIKVYIDGKEEKTIPIQYED
ncbi:serine/threonine-protein kinase [Tumebacillus sp. BK434]|nr:serine/threonine-protein kinase [Tumebacillus sp. BK434]